LKKTETENCQEKPRKTGFNFVSLPPLQRIFISVNYRIRLVPFNALVLVAVAFLS
jgi:hypothetical protein